MQRRGGIEAGGLQTWRMAVAFTTDWEHLEKSHRILTGLADSHTAADASKTAAAAARAGSRLRPMPFFFQRPAKKGQQKKKRRHGRGCRALEPLTPRSPRPVNNKGMGTAMRELAGAIHAEVSRKRRALDIAPAGAAPVPLLTIEGQSLGVGLGTSAGQGVDACANVVELRLRLEPASWRDGHGDGGMTVFLYARRGADGGRPPAASVHPGVGWDALGVHGCPHHPYGLEWLGSDVPVPCSVLGRDGRQCEERGGLCGGAAMAVLPRGSTLGGMAR